MLGGGGWGVGRGLGPVPSVTGVSIKILAPGIHLDTGTHPDTGLISEKLFNQSSCHGRAVCCCLSPAGVRIFKKFKLDIKL